MWKTTLLLELLRDLSSDGGRNLVIENEVEEVGIDGANLEAHGLKVRELYSGFAGERPF